MHKYCGSSSWGCALWAMIKCNEQFSTQSIFLEALAEPEKGDHHRHGDLRGGSSLEMP